MADSWRIHGGKTKGFIKPLALGFNGFLSCVCREWVFWDGLNMHTFNCYHRADRRVKGWVRIHGGFMADSWRIHGGKAKGFIKPLALHGARGEYRF